MPYQNPSNSFLDSFSTSYNTFSKVRKDYEDWSRKRDFEEAMKEAEGAYDKHMSQYQRGGAVSSMAGDGDLTHMGLSERAQDTQQASQEAQAPEPVQQESFKPVEVPKVPNTVQLSPNQTYTPAETYGAGAMPKAGQGAINLYNPSQVPQPTGGTQQAIPTSSAMPRAPQVQPQAQQAQAPQRQAVPTISLAGASDPSSSKGPQYVDDMQYAYEQDRAQRARRDAMFDAQLKYYANDPEKIAGLYEQRALNRINDEASDLVYKFQRGDDYSRQILADSYNSITGENGNKLRITDDKKLMLIAPNGEVLSNDFKPTLGDVRAAANLYAVGKYSTANSAANNGFAFIQGLDKTRSDRDQNRRQNAELMIKAADQENTQLQNMDTLAQNRAKYTDDVTTQRQAISLGMGVHRDGSIIPVTRTMTNTDTNTGTATNSQSVKTETVDKSGGNSPQELAKSFGGPMISLAGMGATETKGKDLMVGNKVVATNTYIQTELGVNQEVPIPSYYASSPQTGYNQLMKAKNDLGKGGAEVTPFLTFNDDSDRNTIWGFTIKNKDGTQDQVALDPKTGEYRPFTQEDAGQRKTTTTTTTSEQSNKNTATQSSQAKDVAKQKGVMTADGPRFASGAVVGGGGGGRVASTPISARRSVVNSRGGVYNSGYSYDDSVAKVPYIGGDVVPQDRGTDEAIPTAKPSKPSKPRRSQAIATADSAKKESDKPKTEEETKTQKPAQTDQKADASKDDTPKQDTSKKADEEKKTQDEEKADEKKKKDEELTPEEKKKKDEEEKSKRNEELNRLIEDAERTLTKGRGGSRYASTGDESELDKLLRESISESRKNLASEGRKLAIDARSRTKSSGKATRTEAIKTANAVRYDRYGNRSRA